MAEDCGMNICTRKASRVARLQFQDGFVKENYYCKTHAPLYGKGSFVDGYGQGWRHGALVDVTVEPVA